MSVADEPWRPATPAAARELPQSGAQLWLCPLDDDCSEAGAALLDAGERRRAAGFRTPLLRARFIAAHAALRSLVGAALDRPPADLRLVAATGGKPELAPGQGELHFNLSHSGGWALIGLSTRWALGVDVELVRPDPPLQVSSMAFSAREKAVLEALPASRKGSFFYAAWTRKEALAKATGQGMATNFRALDVADGWAEGGGEVRAAALDGPPSLWRFHPLPPLDGAAVALALPALEGVVECLLLRPA
ncbi:4'-phosphopantetheinyl transferase family protein [Pseudoroseomonas globiformis]|uniref:4'-phosphopantetheinyl transferase family protein n=1 Tax=Teichococcus globiformis TaxID=2307229 RepID=A0ABV7FUM3_9PROT